METSVRYQFPISPATYMNEVYLNAEFTRSMYLDGLMFEKADIVSHETVGGRVHRSLQVRPKMNAPAIVKKVLGATQEYLEAGELDESGLLWTYTVTPSTLASKITIAGSLRVVPTADGCEAQYTGNFNVKIFGAGGAIEKFMVGQFTDNLEKQSRFTRQWINTHHQ
jgi:hypothetical protein